MPVRSKIFWIPVLRSYLKTLKELLFIVTVLGWLSAGAFSQVQTCQPNQPSFNVTLRAGSASGNFWKLGPVKDVNRCGQLCCQHHKCDLAFSVDNVCYNVECYNKKMCRLKKKNFSRHQVAVTMVTRINKEHQRKTKDRHVNKAVNANQTVFNKGIDNLLAAGERKNVFNQTQDEDGGSKEFDNKFGSHSFTSLESKDTGVGFELQNSFPTKAVVRLESKLLEDGSKDAESASSGSCRARKILRKVTLRSGLQSGDFSDYGQVSDIEACVRHCCAQKTCDVSLLLKNHCYTLHCHKPELCETIPAHGSKLDPQLAFVVRSVTDDQSNTRIKKKTSSSDRGVCPHGAIFRDVSLKGGKKAGKFKIMARTSDMRTCIQKCCASPSCQVAWLLGDYCYSVACYDKCITIKKGSSDIRSQLTLLTRKSQQTENDKRQDIPGAKGNTDKVFRVFLTLTDQVFRDQLKDIESLEFLNLAEKLQVAVSSVFVNEPSFKTDEVVSFQPSPVVAQLTLAMTAQTSVSKVLKPLIDAVITGQLNSSIDGSPISFKVSNTGFRFLTSNGVNLVCGAEHDYDVSWKLMMFNSTDTVICPRNAQGKTSRFCAGSETLNATWQAPDFSECVSPAYKTLHQETKDLADRAEKKLPFAPVSSGQIISRLEKLVFTDTFREELYKSSLADQRKNMAAKKRNNGKKGSKLHDKPTFLKNTIKGDKKEDPNSVPVTEIPRAPPEILPTTPAHKSKDPNPVWFSAAKTKLFASNPKSSLGSKNLNLPTLTRLFETTPPVRASSTTVSGLPVQNSGNMNRIPTQASLPQQARVLGPTENMNSFSRSQIQSIAQSNAAIESSQRKNPGVLNQAQYKSLSPMRNTFQKAQFYQSQNPRLVPGYGRSPNPYELRGYQNWQGNRAAGYQRSWGQGYSPPSYSSEQLDIGRRKRDVDDGGKRQRRQNTVWYNTRQYPSQYNYPAMPGMIPRTNYIQSTNYYRPNNYQNAPNQAAANKYQTGYQRSPYGKSLGTRLSPAVQRRPQTTVVAPGSRSDAQAKASYGTQPGILSGGHPSPVERWPTLGNIVQKPTQPLRPQNGGKSVSPSVKSNIAVNTNQKPNLNVQIDQTEKTSKVVNPTNSKTSFAHKKQNVSGSKNAGPRNDLSKKLQDLSHPNPRTKTQSSAHKRQNLTVSPLYSDEKHVVPMFAGDILLSAGVLQLLQKFARLSGSKVTETELKTFVNASSHLLDLKNRQEWINAQKHAEALYKKGINVLEDSSNWDWDESQQLASQEDPSIGPVVLDLVVTVQAYVMKASNSISLDKPLVTKNILLGVHTFGPDNSNPTRPMSFPNYSDPLVANWSSGRDSITLTPSIFDSALLGNSVNVRLLTSRFKTVSQLLPGKNDSGLVLNSEILSSTAQPDLSDKLDPPVKIVLSVLNSSLVRFEQQCVSWNSKGSQGGEGGKWSPEGCKLTASNATHTTCECNHMTDFAVLANSKQGMGVGAPHPSAAVPSAGSSKDRSWIGILLGILFLLLFIIVVLLLLFYWRKKRRSQEQESTPRSRSGGLRRSRSLSRSTAKKSRSSSAKSDGAVSPASSHSSQFDEMIAARRRRMAQDKQEKARRAREEGHEDEIDDDDLLMKEKAMLFSDYHQPYHFLSKEKDTQAASNRREQPGSSRPSPPRRSRRPAMDQDGSDV